MFSYSNTPIKCNCDDQKTGLIDENILKSKEQLPVKGKVEHIMNSWFETSFFSFNKDLYFGGSSWSISWLYYALGPMKCSGKQQLYPPDVERLNKQIKEQKFIDVVNKAERVGSPKLLNSEIMELDLIHHRWSLFKVMKMMSEIWKIKWTVKWQHWRYHSTKN